MYEIQVVHNEPLGVVMKRGTKILDSTDTGNIYLEVYVSKEARIRRRGENM